MSERFGKLMNSIEVKLNCSTMSSFYFDINI